MLELALTQLAVSVEVYTPDDRCQQRVICINAALDQESPQTGGVNEAKGAIIDLLVTELEVVIGCRGELLLEHLDLASQRQLFLDQLREQRLDCIRQTHVRVHSVRRSLCDERA